MGTRNPKTGRYETAETARARLAQEKAERELEELKAEIKRKEQEELEKQMQEEAIWDEQDPEQYDDMYASRGEQFCILILSICIMIAIFALVWWVATQIRPLLFG